MVDKTYHLEPYLVPFGAYLMPRLSIYGSKGVSIHQNDHLEGGGQLTLSLIWSKKTLFLIF